MQNWKYSSGTILQISGRIIQNKMQFNNCIFELQLNSPFVDVKGFISFESFFSSA